MSIKLQELEKKTWVLPDNARKIKVTDHASLEKANEFLLIIKGLGKQLSDELDPIIVKTNKAHKEAVALKKKYEAPLKEAERYLKGQIGPYLAELDRRRREAEERARKEREEVERMAREEEEKRFAAALKAEEEGKIEEAEKIITKEPIVPVLTKQIIPEKPKLEGTCLKKIAKWRLVNLKEVPRDMLMLDSAKITRLVKETKGQIQIPGIEVYFEDQVATRGLPANKGGREKRV